MSAAAKIMKLLIEIGACVGVADTPDCGHVMSALHRATNNNQYEAAVLLLEKGASVNTFHQLIVGRGWPSC